ncbi:MAG: hypothetical protein HUK00_02250 [Bacteroidaceae bacterium]|nr:hypothetical protein [Bacteroidaceae bacterium]
MTSDLSKLLAEFKDYVSLEKRYALISVAEKGTVIISILLIVWMLFTLASIATAFLLLGLANYIGETTGSMAIGYATVAILTIVIISLFYAMRTRLVVNPIARMMRRLFVTTTNDAKQ